MSSPSTLDDQIAQRSKEISTEAYAMSVGELLSLYRDGELNIHPEFQRFFRWSHEQKCRLVESLLLGIPVPPIFVSQDGKGKWDVIDGLQRLSTLFELTGDLLDEDGNKLPQLVLSKTKYLPNLTSKRWGLKEESGDDILSETAKLLIKRARLDIKIVLNKSDASSKFELFDRLNTGGSAATPQEVRNCLLIMIDPEFFRWLSHLGKFPPFVACLPLTDRQIAEQFPLELVVRFLTLRTASPDAISQMPDLGPWLTDRIVELAEKKLLNLVEEERAFYRTFEILAKTLEDDSFRRFNAKKHRSEGAFLISMFEVFAIGLGHYMSDEGYSIDGGKVESTHHSIWEDPKFTGGIGSGVRPTSRLPVTIPLGRELFKP